MNRVTDSIYQSVVITNRLNSCLWSINMTGTVFHEVKFLTGSFSLKNKNPENGSLFRKKFRRGRHFTPSSRIRFDLSRIRFRRSLSRNRKGKQVWNSVLAPSANSSIRYSDRTVSSNDIGATKRLDWWVKFYRFRSNGIRFQFYSYKLVFPSRDLQSVPRIQSARNLKIR